MAHRKILYRPLRDAPGDWLPADPRVPDLPAADNEPEIEPRGMAGPRLQAGQACEPEG